MLLKELHANGVGLKDNYDLFLSERLNIFTGDNGLGKTFILDLCWWAITGSWFLQHAFPKQAYKGQPKLSAELRNDTNSLSRKSFYVQEVQKWLAEKETAHMPGIVIYAANDGRFAVWDSVRQEISKQYYDHSSYGDDVQKPRPVTYYFDEDSLWNGLYDPDTKKVRCKGLLQDVVDWTTRPTEIQHAPFAYLSDVLKILSPAGERMQIGGIQRLYIDDVREIPTLKFDYGEVPVVLCSSAVKRILSLAYLLVWSWREHLRAAEMVGRDPSTSLTFIIDEVEQHLHPQWQRTIMPSLLDVASCLSKDLQLQVMATTHSPLVLASLEQHFQSDKDKLFLLELKDKEVIVDEQPWVREGDASAWLMSDIFGLQQARSIEAEKAIEQARDFLRGKLERLESGYKSKKEIESKLSQVLPNDDPFWPQWIVESR